MAESKYIDSANWGEIEKGYYYQAAMYFLSDTEQPLRFIEEDEDGNLSFHRRVGDFSPQTIDGKHRAVEQKIAITLKPREVIVLSNNNLNQSQDYEYIQVAPVMGIKDTDKAKPIYLKLKADKEAGSVLIDKGNNEIEVVLTQISTIHKSLLLRKRSKVPTERMRLIESRILDILDL